MVQIIKKKISIQMLSKFKSYKYKMMWAYANETAIQKVGFLNCLNAMMKIQNFYIFIQMILIFFISMIFQSKKFCLMDSPPKNKITNSHNFYTQHYGLL